MKKIKATHIRRLIKNNLLGRPHWQYFFDQLHRLVLAGMGHDNGSKIATSGESVALGKIAPFIRNSAESIIFDVGANNGDYSLDVLSTIGNNVSIYALEPSEAAMELYKLNLRDHLGTIRAHTLGLGSQKESAILYELMPGSSLNSLFPRRVDHLDARMQYTVENKVQLQDLDGFCRDNHVEHIDLLKLDTEGNEFNALLGAKNLLDSSAINFIQFEFGGANIDSRTYFQDFFYLLNPNYRLYRILNHGLAPIDVYRERYEISVVTNFLAVSRKEKFRP
jgi:FkbM family methyltransferase